jgi:hypothetical protein
MVRAIALYSLFAEAGRLVDGGDVVSSYPRSRNSCLQRMQHSLHLDSASVQYENNKKRKLNLKRI